MPYFAVSLPLWYMITGLISDATVVFATYGKYFINQRMSFATAINALLYRNVLILLHNAVVVLLVFAIFLKPVGIRSLLALPGLCLAILTGFWLSYVVAILCARYRDLRQLVTNIVQIAFYVTPVLFKEDFIPADYRHLLVLNPFSIYLSIIRDPILNLPVPLEVWVIATIMTVGSFLLALPFIGLYHKRIIYWL
jgi:homopolymeric O-antigen transport system permease protein